MMVKICGVTNVEDAQAAIDAGAAAIGFNFYPKSPRYLTADRAASIAAQLSPQILKVGVFVDAPANTLRDTAAAAGLDIVQLHGSEPPGTWPAHLRVWKAFRVTGEWSASAAQAYDVEALLLDGPAPGTGESWNWQIPPGLRQRVILAGGLDATNVGGAIRSAQPWGVDACSRIEIAPGKKDHDKMRQFIQAAMAENL